MAQPPRSYFTAITNFAEKALDSVRFTRLEFNPDCTIWEIHGSISKFDIRLKEVFIQAGRMYSYYALDQGHWRRNTATISPIICQNSSLTSMVLINSRWN